MATPAKMSPTDIGVYAERVGEHHRIYDEDGRADIDKLVARLGGAVEFSDSRESLHVAHKGKFRIFLPPFTSARRDRFTKAHELGHYFLHYRLAGTDGAASFNRGGRSTAETQANVFAASLLMPSEPFRAAMRDYDGDIYALSRHFDVSPAAAEVRSSVLKRT